MGDLFSMRNRIIMVQNICVGNDGSSPRSILDKLLFVKVFRLLSVSDETPIAQPVFM